MWYSRSQRFFKLIRTIRVIPFNNLDFSAWSHTEVAYSVCKRWWFYNGDEPKRAVAFCSKYVIHHTFCGICSRGLNKRFIFKHRELRCVAGLRSGERDKQQLWFPRSRWAPPAVCLATKWPLRWCESDTTNSPVAPWPGAVSPPFSPLRLCSSQTVWGR